MAVPLIKTPETEQRAPCLLGKCDVVNMICGAPQPPDRVCEQMQGHGYMQRQGDLQEQTWSWDLDALMSQPIEALLAVYMMLKKLDRPLIERVG